LVTLASLIIRLRGGSGENVRKAKPLGEEGGSRRFVRRRREEKSSYSNYLQRDRHLRLPVIDIKFTRFVQARELADRMQSAAQRDRKHDRRSQFPLHCSVAFIQYYLMHARDGNRTEQ